MLRRPPRSTRPDTLFPDTTLFRSADKVRALVAIDHRLENFGLERQHPLDPLRRDIVAFVVDDQVLLAIGDDDAALSVDMADIAGMQPRPPVGDRKSTRLNSSH